jgi:hypothetical protein
MSKIDNIEREIQELTSSELAAFQERFREFDATVWDQKIEEDARAGRFDALAEEAIEGFNSGRCSEL